MIRHKRKQVLYDTEDDNFVIPNFSENKPMNMAKRKSEWFDVKSDKPNVKPDPVEPVQPPEPQDKAPMEFPKDRPGAFDPYYRIGVKPNTTPKPPKPEKPIEFPKDRPGSFDLYYRYLNKPTQSTIANPLFQALKGPTITDAEGLQKAYKTDSNIYVYIYGDTPFISGTKGTPFISKDGQQNYKHIY